MSKLELEIQAAEEIEAQEAWDTVCQGCVVLEEWV